jgi:hypothetical protein
MTACANCARELRPEWKFCVRCGMPTGVTSARPETRSIPIVSAAPTVAAPPVAAPPVVAPPVTALVAPVLEPEPVTAAVPMFAAPVAPIPVPVPAPVPAAVLAPVPAPVPAAVLAPAPAIATSAPTPVATLLDDAPSPTLEVTAPATGAIPAISLRTVSRERRARRRVNALAIVALVLGCLASPLAALFGHIALAQIHGSGQRGRVPAIAAIVLGYGALAFVVGLGVIYLTAHG